MTRPQSLLTQHGSDEKDREFDFFELNEYQAFMNPRATDPLSQVDRQRFEDVVKDLRLVPIMTTKNKEGNVYDAEVAPEPRRLFISRRDNEESHFNDEHALLFDGEKGILTHEEMRELNGQRNDLPLPKTLEDEPKETVVETTSDAVNVLPVLRTKETIP